MFSGGGGGGSILNRDFSGHVSGHDLIASGLNSGYGYAELDLISAVSVPSVPLPAAAPMFGAALLSLGLIGYGVKSRKAATA